MFSESMTDLPAPPRAQTSPGRKLPAGDAYLEGLNAEQRGGVCGRGPVLVLAGAGTGKTRFDHAVGPHSGDRQGEALGALVVTFTNKAAREMRERIAKLIGPSSEGLRWLGTFHSVAAQICGVMPNSSA